MFGVVVSEEVLGGWWGCGLQGCVVGVGGYQGCGVWACGAWVVVCVDVVSGVVVCWGVMFRSVVSRGVVSSVVVCGVVGGGGFQSSSMWGCGAWRADFQGYGMRECGGGGCYGV